MFDFGAKEGNLQLYPHTYGGYAKPSAKREVDEKVVHVAKPAKPARHVLPQASDQNSRVFTM
jgi:hypothetical protein